MLQPAEFAITCDGGMGVSAWGGGRFITLPYQVIIASDVGGVKFVPGGNAVVAIDFSHYHRFDKDEISGPAIAFLSE